MLLMGGSTETAEQFCPRLRAPSGKAACSAIRPQPTLSLGTSGHYSILPGLGRVSNARR